MFGNIINDELSTVTKTIVALSALVVALVAISSAGAAEVVTDELLNETVEVDEDTDPLEVTVEFNETLEADGEVTATFWNESEFQDDPDTATEYHNVTVTGDGGERIIEAVEFGKIAELDYDTEYRLTVEGNESDVSSVEVDGTVGAALVWHSDDSVPGFLGGAAIAAIALATAGLLAVRRG